MVPGLEPPGLLTWASSVDAASCSLGKAKPPGPALDMSGFRVRGCSGYCRGLTCLPLTASDQAFLASGHLTGHLLQPKAEARLQWAVPEASVGAPLLRL